METLNQPDREVAAAETSHDSGDPGEIERMQSGRGWEATEGEPYFHQTSHKES